MLQGQACTGIAMVVVFQFAQRMAVPVWYNAYKAQEEGIEGVHGLLLYML